MNPRPLIRTALAATAALAVLATAVPAHAADPIVLDDGHIDAIAPRVLDGELRLQVKDSRDSSDIQWREPGEIVMHAVPESEVAVPEGDQWEFLGEPGDPFWCFPMTQRSGVLWPGWSTEALTADEVPGGVELALTAVDGPGTFALFMTGSFGDVQHIFNGDQSLPQAIDVPLHTHAHANWAFTAEGVYRLTFAVTGESASGSRLSDTQTYAVAVGDVDPTQVEPGGGAPDPDPTEPAPTDTPSSSESTSGPDDGGAAVQGTVAGGDTLPVTGNSGLVWIVGAGALALLLGVAMLTALRLRRRSPTAADTDEASR